MAQPLRHVSLKNPGGRIEVVNTQQRAHESLARLLNVLSKRPCTPSTDDRSLEAFSHSRLIGQGHLSVAQPRPRRSLLRTCWVAVAAIQNLEQRVADDGKLVNVLMPIHMRGRTVPDRFKGIELAMDHLAGVAMRQGSQRTPSHQNRQGHAMTCSDSKRAGPVQVQAHAGLSRMRPQHLGIAGPTG